MFIIGKMGARRFETEVGTMTEELQARLMGVKLTKKEKLIAEFILDNFAEACFITSSYLRPVCAAK